MTTQQIISDITNYIGNKYASWYVGITSDARQRLFIDHKVIEKGGYWIYREADTNNGARLVERYFLNLGCDGGTGGGDNTSRIVYVYLKTNDTDP